MSQTIAIRSVCERCGHELYQTVCGRCHEISDANGVLVSFPVGEQVATASGGQSFVETSVRLCAGCIEEFWLGYMTGCGAELSQGVAEAYGFAE